MRHVALVATLLLASCAGGEENKSDAIEVTGTAATPTALGPAPAETKGQDFVATVLGGYDFALKGAAFAGERAERAEVKASASKLTTDLTESLDTMKIIAGQQGLRLEPKVGPTAETDLAVLGSAKGDSFDRAYAERQMENLTLLVGLLRAYKNGGDNTKLQGWANQAQEVVNNHLLETQTLSAVVEEGAGS